MTLLAPLFLLGLLGLAIPWILHRLQEQDAPVTDFPSKKFLKTTSSNTARRKRLRFRWLLSLRWLLLALLCLLFAEPLVNVARSMFNKADTAHLLVIDNSFSMQHGERWENALDQASELLDTFADDAKVDVLLANESMQLLSSGATDQVANPDAASGSADAEAVERQLAALKSDGPSTGRLRFEKMMDAVARYARDTDLPAHAHIITDGQQSGLAGGFNTLYRERLQNLDIYNVSNPDDYNISVQAQVAWLSRDSLLVEARVLWSLANATDTAGVSDLEQKITVEVASGSEVLAASEVSLKPGQPQTVRFPNIPLSASLQRELRDLDAAVGNTERLLPINVSVQDTPANAGFLNDLLPADNAVTLGVAPHKAQQIRILAQQPLARQNTLTYLNTAFRQMQGVNVGELKGTVGSIPADTDLLIIVQESGNYQLPDSARRFLDDGGAILQVLGAPEETTDTLLQSSSGDTNALPTIQRADPLTRVDITHPLALSLRDWSEVNLYRQLWSDDGANSLKDAMATLIRNSGNRTSSDANTSLDPSAGYREFFAGTASVLVASNLGQPVLLEPGARASAAAVQSPDRDTRPLKWLVLATPLDARASNLPLSPVFVTFLNKVRQYLLQERRYPEQLFSGETLVLGANIQLLSPSGEPVFELGSDDSNRSYTFDKTGSYVILDRVGQQSLQVVLDPAESNIESFSADGLSIWAEQYASGRPDGQADEVAVTGQQQKAGDDPVNAGASREEKRGLPLWQWLLPLVVLAGLLEMLFGNFQLARYRRTIA